MTVRAATPAETAMIVRDAKQERRLDVVNELVAAAPLKLDVARAAAAALGLWIAREPAPTDDGTLSGVVTRIAYGIAKNSSRPYEVGEWEDYEFSTGSQRSRPAPKAVEIKEADLIGAVRAFLAEHPKHLTNDELATRYEFELRQYDLSRVLELEREMAKRREASP